MAADGGEQSRGQGELGDRARLAANPFSALGSKRGGHRGEMLRWHFASKRAKIRAFPVCADHVPAMTPREEGRGQTHKLEETVGNNPALKPRQGGSGSRDAPQSGSRVQPSFSPC